ncbi:hypothetical protein, partial [Providencia stuartii]|uniref:hypothetical protein n=1 Tax=Providencia stuartii TaxID=588 RepID=UPI0024ABD584
RNQWSHFLPESITDLPLVARHASPSEIIIMYYLTIPFGIGSKPYIEKTLQFILVSVLMC